MIISKLYVYNIGGDKEFKRYAECLQNFDLNNNQSWCVKNNLFSYLNRLIKYNYFVSNNVIIIIVNYYLNYLVVQCYNYYNDLDIRFAPKLSFSTYLIILTILTLYV